MKDRFRAGLRNRWLRRAAAWGATVLIVLFAARLIGRAAGGMSQASFHPAALALVFCFLLLVLSRIGEVEGWFAVLRPWNPARLTSARVFTVAELFRYLPGGVVHFGARYRLGTVAGLPPEVMVTTSAIDLALRLGVALASFVLCLPWWPGVPSGYVWLSLALLPVLAVAATPRVVTSALTTAQRKLGKGTEPAAIPYGDVLRAAAWFGVSSVLRGLALFAALRAVSPVGPELILPSIGAAALAWAVGVLVPFAPGGLGVREATGVAVLVSVVSLQVATFAMLASRIASVAAEFAVAGLVVLLARLRPPLVHASVPAGALADPITPS